jgi:hypothetical protein
VLFDPAAVEGLAKLAFVKIEYRKDGPEAKRFKVPGAPLLLLLDPTGEEPKELKRVAGGSAKEIRSQLDAALKRLQK